LKAKNSDDEDDLADFSPARDNESKNLIPTTAINESIDRETGAYQRKRESSLMKEEYSVDGQKDDWRKRDQRLDDLNLSSHVAANTLRESLNLKPTALKKLLIESAAMESGKPADEEDHGFGELMIH